MNSSVISSTATTIMNSLASENKVSLFVKCCMLQLKLSVMGLTILLLFYIYIYIFLYLIFFTDCVCRLVDFRHHRWSLH